MGEGKWRVEFNSVEAIMGMEWHVYEGSNTVQTVWGLVDLAPRVYSSDAKGLSNPSYNHSSGT